MSPYFSFFPRAAAGSRDAAFAGCLSLIALLGGSSGAQAAPFRIDPAQTHVTFAIGAKGYPVTRGEFHRFSATLAIDATAPARSHVAFDVSAASIDTHAPVLDEYVRGAGFLDTAHHPDIAFRSTSVRKLDERTVELTGELTLLGVTLPETFRVTATPTGGDGYSLVAEGNIRRSDFGMTGGLPLVSDEVTITVAAIAKSQ